MPIRTYTTKVDYDVLYDINVGDGVHLNYSRSVLYPLAERNAAGLVNALNIGPSDTTAIIGCGYGWMVEAWPYANVVGVDNGTHIQATINETETSDIRNAIIAAGLDPDVGKGAAKLAKLDDGGTRGRVVVMNEDTNTQQGKREILSALGLGNNEKMTWAITEYVIESLEDAEVLALSSVLSTVAHNVAHLFIPREKGYQEPDMNWKLPQWWRNLHDADGQTEVKFVRTGTFGVF